ncbi:MAG: beta-lactamase family protein [Clostridia bacterium]|nr:beta-lactamase family protein [Clostridia bacterium]
MNNIDFTYLKNFMDSLTGWIIPGNCAVVYKDGKKVFEYSSGFADLENRVPMTGKEQLYIYSCSKIATVTAALQLYEQGKFLLSDPLYEYIPEYADMKVKTGDNEYKKAEKPITIQNLFTMTAGFTYNTNTPAFQKARQITNGKMDTMTVVKCLSEDPLMFEPGERWNYSLCHDILAGVVEVISGKKFSDYVKENIFDKLGMKNSYYHITPEIMAKMAHQYRYETENEQDLVNLQSGKFRNGKVVDTGLSNHLVFGDEYDSGGAGIITTADDYALFSAALANGGMGLNKNRILSSSTIELLKQNQLNEKQLPYYNWPQLKGYGYGLGVRTMIDKAAGGSPGSMNEFGWGGAAGATVLIDTDLNLAAFYSHHMLNPQEEYYQPRFRNVLYSCLD